MCESKNETSLDENQIYILEELIEFLKKTCVEKAQVTWSIGRQHVKLLCKFIKFYWFNLFILSFFFKDKLLESSLNADNQVNILKVFQLISKDKNTVKVLMSEIGHLKMIIQNFKAKDIQTIEYYFQWVCF